MASNIYKQLHEQSLLNDESYERLQKRESLNLFSVHWELNLLLYTGVLLLTAGLGTLIYKNIDTIGHQAILAFIALLCIGCFYYCFKHKAPFSSQNVASPNTGFDYILLLGSILMVTFLGYIQYQYNLFGNNYNLAAFIPMVILFFIAYRFDHLGILSMAITSLAVWMGISVTPKTLLLIGDFSSLTLIYTYLLLGFILLAAAWLTEKFRFKKHFKFSYQNYGTHVTFIALLAGFFHFFEHAYALMWCAVILSLAGYLYRDAYKNHSFYFILTSVLYGYITLCGLGIRMLDLFEIKNIGGFYLLLLLIISSTIGLIFFLINTYKNLKSDDHL
ncbi:DUF2157 domain-containing protein [Mucilaginibacter sp. 44-25]|uniref:DUF2157 domain-containing protein n=1 Tax=Mucilaginibacter sp. 44-25 TaxID=1895794 RepID=UPI00095C33A1|nr:DUF2157 domain-containing protein [Mucilaginibacter sp. 44-25]OJW13587.1 MAG: DUF2157 domain-containing protein [Mucilaginibacter sp. 44-25]